MKKLDCDAVEYISSLAKLELSAEEKQQAALDLERMLAYMQKLEELDTDKTEPLYQVHPVWNVFREDTEESGQGEGAPFDRARADTLSNAPCQHNGMFVVPDTLGR